MSKLKKAFAKHMAQQKKLRTSAVYKRWLAAKRNMAAELQNSIDEQCPGRTLRTWKAIRDEDGKLAFEVTFKD